MYLNLWAPCQHLEFRVHCQEFLGTIMSSCSSLPDISLWWLVHVWFAHGEVSPQAWFLVRESHWGINTWHSLLFIRGMSHRAYHMVPSGIEPQLPTAVSHSITRLLSYPFHTPTSSWCNLGLPPEYYLNWNPTWSIFWWRPRQKRDRITPEWVLTKQKTKGFEGPWHYSHTLYSIFLSVTFIAYI